MTGDFALQPDELFRPRPVKITGIDSARLCPLMVSDDQSDDGEVVVDGFVVACGDAAVLFQPADHSFDDVAFSVLSLHDEHPPQVQRPVTDDH